MADSYLWGISLDGDKKLEIWCPDLNDSQERLGDHSLHVKHIVLGADAKEGEVNVVEVNVLGYSSELTVPIAVVKGGSTSNQAKLDLFFPDPVSFQLSIGSGPVHILGNHSVQRIVRGKEASTSQQGERKERKLAQANKKNEGEKKIKVEDK